MWQNDELRYCMIIGIPKGLLYYKYYYFFENFFRELGADIVTSPDSNKKILDDGVKYCVDEACLPVKIFHGHVNSIKDKCDLMFIPRIMRVRDNEYICPKFCGLPEMILNSVPNMPNVIENPIYANTKKNLFKWAYNAGGMITKNKFKIEKAFEFALEIQRKSKGGIKNDGFDINIALVGHPYNIYDSFINMNLVKKLNTMGVGVITEEFIDDKFIDREVNCLYKRPFWTFARNSYGYSVYLAKNKKVDGIIYISSFACGIDSVVIELIKDNIAHMPMLILKIDEQTGEAGLDTRVEAFVDMMERRKKIESNISTHGKHISCG
jgi:predicted nucleotide-binding protein (sugar kinase/HSP70/actin superfamily)